MKRKILQFRHGLLEESEEEFKPINKQKERKGWLKALNTAFDLGGSIALPIAGGAIGGYYIDNKFGTAPKVTLIFLFVGIVIGFYNIIRLTRDIS